MCEGSKCEEVLKQYEALRGQCERDLLLVKEAIYEECSTLMKKQFALKDAAQTALTNAFHFQKHQLKMEKMELQGKLKIAQGQAKIVKSRQLELEKQISLMANENKVIRNTAQRREQQIQQQLKEQREMMEKRMKEAILNNNKEKEIQELKGKVREFQKKYQVLIPEVEKMKINLAAKEEINGQLCKRLQQMKEESKKEGNKLKNQRDQFEKQLSQCRIAIAQQQNTINQINSELDSAKRMKKQIRLQPLYIQKPIQVEKIVQRIVTVEKIVKEYIQPSQQPTFEEENSKLKEQIKNVLKEMTNMETNYKAIFVKYQESLKVHQENAKLYIKEREVLVRKIQDLYREMDGGGKPLNELIKVNVTKDGKYTKTVEKRN